LRGSYFEEVFIFSSAHNNIFFRSDGCDLIDIDRVFLSLQRQASDQVALQGRIAVDFTPKRFGNQELFIKS